MATTPLGRREQLQPICKWRTRDLPRKNPVYDWSPDIQGIILSSFFYGSILVHIPIGYFSGIYSVKKMVGSAILLSSVFCLFIPLAADLGKTTIILCRVLQGIAQSTVVTGQHEIWVRWAPPLERGRLTSISSSGCLLGPFIALLVTGLICQSLGWPMVFYIFGACGCALCLPWFILVYDDPKDHPCISISEKEYITSSTVQQFISKRKPLPIKAMLKSLPLWAIYIGNIATFWTNSIMSLYGPMFLNSMFHVNVRENGLLSALPHLFAWIFGNFAGLMSDFFLSRNILRLLTIRKLFASLGLLLPALFSVCLLYLSPSFLSTIIFLILITATGIFNMVGTFLNALDIAPRYFGFLRGVTHFIGVMGGLMASTLTGIIINQDPETSWFKIFILLSAVNVGSSIFYLVFAAVEVQDWARDREQTLLRRTLNLSGVATPSLQFMDSTWTTKRRGWCTTTIPRNQERDYNCKQDSPIHPPYGIEAPSQ
ncbi:sodium-dependent phosphate transport protein 1-like isoform X2 [Dasypus novemcinctus]|uniref:sodium-dependent phosphate transport protein 1-like isoform X2 n=1 Tax=Dasypus novemcinctus TaxID=9361 RepID=UPI00265E786A|nr:sodium-dependent phosphate transport protein 1-like isoform X2 [Dasypus novemcinctus]